MTLGTFQPRARVTGDKLNLQQYAGRPLLVRTMEYVPDFASTAYPNPKPVVFADVVDLISGQIFINVLWGAGAVVDNLKDKTGTEEVVPVKPGNVTSPKSGRSYIALFPLEDGELQAAVGWYNQNWKHVDATRAQRMQAAAAAAPAPQGVQAPAPVTQPAATQYQPVNQGPAAGYAQPQFGQAAPMAAPVDLHGDGSVMVAQPGGQGYVPPAQPQYNPAPPVGPDPNAANGGAQYTGQPAQFGQPQYQGQPQAANPQFGQPQAQAAPAPQYAPAQGFGAPQGGVFNDAPPAPAAGAPVQFGAPQGQDPAATQAALAHLNQTTQQPQG